MRIQIINNKNERLFPAKVFSKRNNIEISNSKEIRELLLDEEAIVVNSKMYSENGKEKEDFFGELKKEDIVSIIDIPDEEVNIEEILTLSEAAKKWGLADGSSVRKAIDRGKFKDTEIKQAGNVWIVTYAGMERVFGEIKAESYLVYEKELQYLINCVYSLDVSQEYSKLPFFRAPKGYGDCFDNKFYSKRRDRLIELLKEIRKKIKSGETIVFKSNQLGKEKINRIINSEDELIYFINLLVERRHMIEKTANYIKEEIFND